MMKANALKFANHSNMRVRALYKSQCDPHAVAYKSAPVRPSLFFETDEFQITARRSLGMDIAKHRLRCDCEQQLDPKADHECALNGAWVKRHNALRNLAHEVACEGFIESKLELTVTFPPECSRCQETLSSEKHNCKKPDEKSLKPSKQTYRGDQFIDAVPGVTLRKTLVNFTVKNEFLPTYLPLSAEKLGAAAELGEKEKNDKFKRRVEKLGYDFLAVSCDSMGSLRPQGQHFFNYLIGQRAIHKGMSFAESASLFWHKWSFIIHRENARNILTRYRTIICHQPTRKTSLYM